MINKKFIEKLKSEYTDSGSERRQIGSLANVALFESKKIIFALHRGDLKPAEEKFKEVEAILAKLDKNFGVIRLYQEGSFKAAVEEYVEAKMLYLVLSGQKLDVIKGIKLNYETYLGGICDLIGEMVRVATNEAAAGKFVRVKEIKELVNEIMAQLVDFDLTGYLRTKYDQARGHLRKIEQMDYEIKLRKD